MVSGQQALWNEQRVKLKFSYTPGKYAALRPGTLGKTPLERLFKDYNAQTYWLSGNISSFRPALKKLRWLNVAIGYGSDGMLGGFDNTYTSDGIFYDRRDVGRYRQWYLAPDVDWSRIKTKKKWLKTTFVLLNCLRFPSPALELSNNKLKFRPLIF
jgi:hypothetical protein